MFPFGPDYGKLAADIVENRRIQKEFDELEQKIANQDWTIQNQQNQINQLQKIVRLDEDRINEQKTIIFNQDQQIKDLNKKINNEKSKRDELKQYIINKDQQVTDLNQIINTERKKRNNLKRDWSNKDQQVSDLKKQCDKYSNKRDYWKFKYQISEAVLSAQLKQLFMVLCLIHAINPRLFNDPKKRLHKKLETKAHEGLIDYLNENYYPIKNGYQFIKACFINSYEHKLLFNKNLFDQDLHNTMQLMENRRPKWFKKLYDLWPPIEEYWNKNT